jgi:DHA1 family tetracycline resistance protein-like MFS transporter
LPRRPGAHALLFVFLTVLIDTIGFGIIIPVIPKLIVELTATDLAGAARYGGLLLFVYAALQFLCSPVLGNLSDRFGRRPVLLLSLVSFGIDYLIMAVAPTFAWLLVGRALAGMAGAVYSPANAYVADITPPERRAKQFGILGAAFGLGFIIGPAIGGLLAGLGSRAPFFAAAGLAFLNAGYGFLVLPETLPPERRRPFSFRRANPVGTLVALRRYPGVLVLAGGLFLWQVAHQVYPSSWSFYTMLKFGWSEAAVGWSLAYVGVTMAIVQGYVTGAVVPRLGERRAVAIGIGFGVTGYVVNAFASMSWMLYASMTVAALQGLVYPSMNALMSRSLPDNRQGELQGGIASLYSLSSIVGPLLMTQTLGYFGRTSAVVYLPGAPFLVAAVLALGALAALRVRDRVEPPATAEG